MRTAPMRQPSARRKLPVAVNTPAVVPRTVRIAVAHAGSYHCTTIAGLVIVRSRIAVIISGWIITGVIRSHVWSLCASAQKSCNKTCAKDRQQYWNAMLRFRCRFHQMFPFLHSDFPLLTKPPTRPRVACWFIREACLCSAKLHCTIRFARHGRPHQRGHFCRPQKSILHRDRRSVPSAA